MVHRDNPGAANNLVDVAVAGCRTTPGAECIQAENQGARRSSPVGDVQTGSAVCLKSRLVAGSLRYRRFGIARGRAREVRKLLTLPTLVGCEHVILNVHAVDPAVGGDLNHQSVKTGRDRGCGRIRTGNSGRRNGRPKSRIRGANDLARCAESQCHQGRKKRESAKHR